MNGLAGLIATLVVTVLSVCGCGSGSSSSFDYKQCPKWNPVESITAESPGTRGEAAPSGPTSALVCRWQEVGGRFERAERVVRAKGPLTSIVKALDALGPHHEIEGVHSCEEAPPQAYFIVLRYPSGEDVPIEAEYESCRHVTNVSQGATYEVSDRLSRALDAVLPAGEG